VKNYLVSCVDLPRGKVKYLNECIDNAIDITYRTFMEHVNQAQVRELFPFYEWKPGRQPGLRLKDDFAVSYHRSKFMGKICYYMRHSAIEYIFT